MKKITIKSKSTKILKPLVNKDKGYSEKINLGSIVSRETTPSEFPMVKNAVNFFLNNVNSKKRKMESTRSVFSPLSMSDP